MVQFDFSETTAPKPARRRGFAAIACACAAILAPVSASAQTVLRDAEIEHTLRSYGDPLFTAAGLNAPDVRVYLLADKSMNAFVTGGQNMFLHTGIIMETEVPNELIGVMAHETGHLRAGHIARSEEAMENAMVPAYVTIALGVIAIAAGAGDAGMALLASAQQFALLDFFTYTRVQESNADQLAVQYLEATGQSGKGLLSFFERFRHEEIMTEARRSAFFRSHPLSADRINALSRIIDNQAHRDTPDSDKAINDLAIMQAKIHGFMETTAATYAHYPSSDQSIPARYARAIATFRAPDLTVAAELTRALIAEQPDNPYFQELLGQIYFENGRALEAVGPYRRAVELAPNEPLLQIGYARALAGVDDPQSLAFAQTALNTAIRLEPDNAFAWNQLAKIADEKGDTGLARMATAEEAFALGDMPRANQFAQAALHYIDRGSPQGLRALDILETTDRAAALAASRGNRRRN